MSSPKKKTYIKYDAETVVGRRFLQSRL